jgi:hypothetical protein
MKYGFDPDPKQHDQERQNCTEADHPDPSCELQCPHGNGNGDQEIDEHRPAGSGARGYVIRELHHLSPVPK